MKSPGGHELTPGFTGAVPQPRVGDRLPTERRPECGTPASSTHDGAAALAVVRKLLVVAGAAAGGRSARVMVTEVVIMPPVYPTPPLSCVLCLGTNFFILSWPYPC